ncbi:MAG: type II secretion system protein [Acidimicrobiales bacterium]
MTLRHRKKSRPKVPLSEGGFTLIELIVVMMIFSIISVMVAITLINTERLTNSGLATVHGVDSSVAITSSLLPLLEGSQYPPTTGPGSWAASLESPVVVACPEELLFFASPPSASGSVSSPVWVFAFATPSPAGSPLAYRNIYVLKVVTFPPGSGVAEGIYGTNKGCPNTPPTEPALPGGSLMPVASYSLYLPLNGATYPCPCPYNDYAITGTPPSDALTSPPAVFGYVNGNWGNIWTDVPYGPYDATSGIALSDIIAVRIYVTTKPVTASKATTTSYQAQLTSVVNNQNTCFPYSRSYKPVCYG